LSNPTFITATRVQICCPCGNGALYRAANNVIVLLLYELNIKDWHKITYSHVNDPVFISRSWNRDRWEEINNILIFIDIPGQSISDILPHFIKMREKISEVYPVTSENEPNKKIWITAYEMKILSD